MWSFEKIIGNSSISMREVIISYKDLSRKRDFFEGWSWVRFYNLGLVLGVALKFYSSVAKELKLRVRKFWELICTFGIVTRGTLVRGSGGSLFATMHRVEANAAIKQKPTDFLIGRSWYDRNSVLKWIKTIFT